MNDKDFALLQEVCQSAELIRTFVHGVDFKTFANDVMRRTAVTGQLITLSANTKALSQEAKAEYSHIPWDQLVLIGDGLIRGQDSHDALMIWSVAEDLIPKLAREIEEALSDRELP